MVIYYYFSTKITWFPTMRVLHTHFFTQFLLLSMSFYVILSDGNSTIGGRHKNITCLNYEREALLKFKDEISNDQFGFMVSWGNVDYPDCCTWDGVVCNPSSGHVTTLNLNGFCLESQVIGSSLGELKHLTYLDLSYSHFHGAVIPNFIGNLINLTGLHLSNSNFSGEVPNHLGNLTRLICLDLSSNNGLYVESMHWLSRLAMLRDVNLGGTDLSKANNWSHVMGSLRMLASLQMDGCGLSSPVSSSFLQSPNLYMISLSGNSFTSSSIFHWLFKTHHFAKLLGKSLFHLDLSSNSIEGPIPNMIENLVSLTFLKLSSNSFSGNLPRTIQNLKSLTYLDLSHNSLSLSGFLHDSFGRFEYLTHLDLSCNIMSGTLPDLLGNLVYLNLSHNSFSGRLPYTIEYLDSLTHLDLSHNLLKGTIPSTIGDMHTLTYLDLSYNSLSGPVPASIWNLGSLAHIDISHNPSITDTGDDKMKKGLYVSIGIGIYSGFWGFWVTLVMKDNWRLSYFMFLDNMINKHFGRYRRNYSA